MGLFDGYKKQRQAAAAKGMKFFILKEGILKFGLPLVALISLSEYGKISFWTWILMVAILGSIMGSIYGYFTYKSIVKKQDINRTPPYDNQ